MKDKEQTDKGNYKWKKKEEPRKAKWKEEGKK